MTDAADTVPGDPATDTVPRNPADGAVRSLASTGMAGVAHRRRTPAPGGVARVWAGWQRPVVIALATTTVLRVATELVALVAHYGVVFPHVVARQPGVLSGVWNAWDTGYYLTIAQHGYAASHAAAVPKFIAFAPLYPALVAATHVVTGAGWVVSGQLVSAAATVAAIAGLVHLTTPDQGVSRSGTTVMLLVAFPTAFFLLVDYPESLALALVVWSWIAVRSEHWVVAGIVAACAAMTKYYLVIVAVALLVEVWRAREPRQPTSPLGVTRHDLARATAVVFPSVAAVVAWMVVCQRLYGDPLAFVHVQGEWGRKFAFPWTLAATTAGDLIHLRFLDTSVASVMELFDTVTVSLVAVATVVAWVRVRTSYAVLLGLALCTFTFQTILYSETREVLTLFPFFIVLSRWVDGHPWRERFLLACFLPSAYFLTSRFVTGKFAG